jgi:hypothetical protein
LFCPCNRWYHGRRLNWRGEAKMPHSKVVIIPARPDPGSRVRTRHSDPRYLEGQRLLVEAIRYLIQSDREANREAAELLSFPEHSFHPQRETAASTSTKGRHSIV